MLTPAQESLVVELRRTLLLPLLLPADDLLVVTGEFIKRRRFSLSSGSLPASPRGH